jgi:hypothetical protein
MPDHSPEDNGQEERGVPLTDRGAYQVPSEETLPEPPPNKKIHERRPLPLVPAKKPRKGERECERAGD